jgi:two-component system, OmpR family, sensor histidine kinase CiaH
MIDYKKDSKKSLNNNPGKKKSNIFVRARWKLTIFYTLFISVLVLIFSFIIYFGYLYYLRGDFEHELAGEDHGIISELNEDENHEGISQFPVTPGEMSENASRRLSNIILIADGSIIAVSAFLGYALAGFTLKPIQHNQDAQKRFMSDASHELRTPLSIMKTGIEVELRNPANPLECKPILNSNLEEINRMADLVENLLFILRADSGNEDFKLEKLDLSQVISTVFQNMKPYAEQRKIALIQENQNIPGNSSVKKTAAATFQDSETIKSLKTEEMEKSPEEAIMSSGIFITGDSNKLKQAFYNILKNAVDYSNPGGQVKLTVLKQPKNVQIEVTDNGIGISQEELPLVFERFYRSSKNSEPHNEGSGLGLAITKEIIKKHKGEIKIESSVENWTKVTINLPY